MLNSKQFILIYFAISQCLIWVVTPFFSCAIAQNNNNKRTLTELLREQSEKYGKRISFSSTITNNIYVKTKPLAGTLEDSLDNLLEGTSLGYKVVSGYYYIYKLEPVAVPPLVKVEPKKETEKRKILPPVSPIKQQIIFPYHKMTSTLKFHSIEKPRRQPESPTLAVKTNLLYDITATINLGFEFAVADKYTMDISGNLNTWSFSSGIRKWKHAIVQPELRYWTCERFNGHFVGLHLHAGMFNVGSLPPLGGLISENMQQYRYQGDLYGGGFTYGYHMILSKRLSLEYSIGLGYTFINYDKYPCGKCGQKINNKSRNYFGPTKASISIVYVIK